MSVPPFGPGGPSTIYPSQQPAPAAFPDPRSSLPFPPDAAIAAWGLTKTFGQKAAVNGLNLVVRRGEFFGLRCGARVD